MDSSRAATPAAVAWGRSAVGWRSLRPHELTGHPAAAVTAATVEARPTVICEAGYKRPILAYETFIRRPDGSARTRRAASALNRGRER
jgi:hypothetical protein